MARPVKETPILYGEDARRFLERMKNPPLYGSFVKVCVVVPSTFTHWVFEF